MTYNYMSLSLPRGKKAKRPEHIAHLRQSIKQHWLMTYSIIHQWTWPHGEHQIWISKPIPFNSGRQGTIHAFNLYHMISRSDPRSQALCSKCSKGLINYHSLRVMNPHIILMRDTLTFWVTYKGKRHTCLLQPDEGIDILCEKHIQPNLTWLYPTTPNMFEVVGDGKVKRTQVALFTQVRASCFEQFGSSKPDGDTHGT